MPYKILEDEATADVAFLINGKTLEEVFHDSAIACLDTLADRKTIRPNKTLEFEIKKDSEEKLLFAMLEEVVFLKDTENMVFSDINIKISAEKGKFMLKAKLKGDEINHKKQKLKIDIKAVTLHMFRLSKEKSGKGWEAKLVFDI